ncbi:FAD-dependent oxidoreductase [Geminisphaera colitermitum]|uniref:FAD-dependent oxidoreductase n=1 Tax=Geminisphaera colitermitum TaxID=1148786 RepID=UPI000196527F|nr:FAD-dependent oxidoreductase [Geminisphaera colitermitum]
MPLLSIIRCDVLVYGGSLSGIAAALRVAREGWQVALVNPATHLGGMMVNGLVQWDAQSGQRRCPVLREILDLIETHYGEKSGVGSTDHLAACYDHARHPVGKVEPSVLESILTHLVEAETLITLHAGWRIRHARRRHHLVESVVFVPVSGAGQTEITARVFIDASYEGDLAAQAGALYRVGREGHDETGEPHAGRIYTDFSSASGPNEMVARRFGLHPAPMSQGPIDPRSPRTGDRCVQAYNLRPCLTCDPSRAVPLTAPPPGYLREAYLNYSRKSLALYLPENAINRKATCNSPILPGENWDYPDGDWATRQRIYERHRDFALGLMWFLQNDRSVPSDQQEQFRLWHLCADEFTDNDHLPWEMYVRETRRIVARHVLSEHDLLPHPDTDLARAFDDSIAFTDWYMDSHSCDRDATYGEPVSERYPYDGKLILSHELRPGQIPYRSLLPRGLDNLLVSVCLGATHVAWGAVRLEPCLVHTGEVAGFAAAIALRDGTLPGQLDGENLAAELFTRNVEVRFPLGEKRMESVSKIITPSPRSTPCPTPLVTVFP